MLISFSDQERCFCVHVVVTALSLVCWFVGCRSLVVLCLLAWLLANFLFVHISLSIPFDWHPLFNKYSKEIIESRKRVLFIKTSNFRKDLE